MPAPDAADSYDVAADFGVLYDHVPLYEARPDVPFYVEMARAAEGPVLELGCGSGRVLLPTARAGCSIVGVDRSPAMLARCTARLAREPAAVQARARLEVADLRTFDLGERFALVTLPFRPFQHLVAVAEQLACLAAVRRHLAPGGRLVFDVFNPNFAALAAARTDEREDTPDTPLPDGRRFRRTARIHAVHRVAQWSDVEIVYHVTDADGRTTRLPQRFPMRWFLRWELEHLLARAGLAIEALYGDFARAPLADESPEIVVVASSV